MKYVLLNIFAFFGARIGYNQSTTELKSEMVIHLINTVDSDILNNPEIKNILILNLDSKKNIYNQNFGSLTGIKVDSIIKVDTDFHKIMDKILKTYDLDSLIQMNEEPDPINQLKLEALLDNYLEFKNRTFFEIKSPIEGWGIFDLFQQSAKLGVNTFNGCNFFYCSIPINYINYVNNLRSSESYLIVYKISINNNLLHYEIQNKIKLETCN